MKSLLFIAMLLPFTYAARFETTQIPRESFLPENDLHLQDGKIRGNDMTQERFEQITDEIIAFYTPIAQAHGAKLVTFKKWTDSTVNASAIQYGKEWRINMYGGLARRPEVTDDGYALVVCHELGHHFAGFPFYMDAKWAASEGQADYFATQSCARNIWGSQIEENAKHRLTVDEVPRAKCDAAYTNELGQNLCYRVANGGKSLATLLGALKTGSTPPQFHTPDPTVVTKTFYAHPKAQCRLDTYMSGALCKAAFQPNVIPGKGKPQHNGLEAETEGATYSCTSSGNYTEGLRPTCWFKPRL